MKFPWKDLEIPAPSPTVLHFTHFLIFALPACRTLQDLGSEQELG